MERAEQYEIWVQGDSGKWELAGAFADLEVANVMAQARSTRVRLLRTVYENGKRVLEQVLAEIGAVRN